MDKIDAAARHSCRTPTKPIPFDRARQGAHPNVFYVACIARGGRASRGGLAAAARVGAIGGDEVGDTSIWCEDGRHSVVGSKFCRSQYVACTPGDEFGGRESIFSICHTNEFSGPPILASEPTAACCRVIRCRRDYKRAHRNRLPSGGVPCGLRLRGGCSACRAPRS